MPSQPRPPIPPAATSRLRHGSEYGRGPDVLGCGSASLAPFCLLLLAVAAIAVAGEVAPGHYATQPGWGDLQISVDGERRRFALSAVGANGHACELEGTVAGAIAVADGDGGDARCVVEIVAEADRLELKARGDACRRYCGMRANFQGAYVRLPEDCVPMRREARQRAYLDDYRARRYAGALAKMESFDAECGEFLDWLDKDRFASDRAVTLYHLGRHEDCLRVLDGMRFADARDEAQLREAFWPAPVDWDSYLPIARAAWHNRMLCGRPGPG